MAIQFDHTTQMLRQSLNTRLKRSELLTSNLVNIDTPHYKAQDLAFKGFLKEAEGLAAMPQSSLDGVGSATPTVELDPETTEVVTDKTPAPELDGNNVDLDTQVAAIADNSLRYNAALEIMKRKMALLRYAATGGAG